jgi:hypothetical protein
MTKYIVIQNQQFKIRNIGFVFNRFEGTVYCFNPKRKVFKWERFGDISFSIPRYDTIEDGIRSAIGTLSLKKRYEEITRKKIEDFIKNS